MIAVALVLASVCGTVAAGFAYSLGYGVIGIAIAFAAAGQIAFALLASFWLPAGTAASEEDFRRQIELDLLALRQAREEEAGRQKRVALFRQEARHHKVVMPRRVVAHPGRRASGHLL